MRQHPTDEMTDSEMWRAVREDRQARRAVQRQNGTEEIAELEGYDVKKLTDYQFRVNGRVDIFPTNCRYHVLATGRRGSYGREALVDVLARLLR